MAAEVTTTLLLIFLLINTGVAASTFRVTSLEVPPHADRYTNQTLRCGYNLGNGKLYAIKWYHNEEEFLRYYPAESPHLEVFNRPQIKVIESESDEEKVMLKEVDLSATGEYKCEVNLEWPEFKTASRSSNMTVVVIPQEQPNIEGDVGGHYKVGDRVHLNCTAAPSIPPAALVWLINDKPAPDEYVRHYDHRKVEDGLLISNLGLSFKLSKSDFINGELKLKCTATIAALYTKSDEHSQQDHTSEVRERPPTEGSLTTAGTSGCDSLWTSTLLHHLGIIVAVGLHLAIIW